MRIVALLGIMVVGAILAVGGAVARGDGRGYNSDASAAADIGQFIVVFGLILLTLELFGTALRDYLRERRERREGKKGQSSEPS
jgi:hypothetical protein